MDNTPNFSSPELPRPQADSSFENIPSSPVESNPENLSNAAELINQAQGAVVQAIQPVPQQQPVALPIVPFQQQQSDDSHTSTNPVVAEDNDVLEKEWVDKAKQIVSETRDDPREQTNKFVVMRHDYVKKRYGKEMVVSNDNSGE